MLKKHITEIARAHTNGKGYRIQHKKIVGGKINFKKNEHAITHGAKKALEGVKKALKNPVVRQVAKELGHIVVGVAENYAQQHGVDVSSYSNIQ